MKLKTMSNLEEENDFDYPSSQEAQHAHARTPEYDDRDMYYPNRVAEFSTSVGETHALQKKDHAAMKPIEIKPRLEERLRKATRDLPKQKEQLKEATRRLIEQRIKANKKKNDGTTLEPSISTLQDTSYHAMTKREITEMAESLTEAYENLKISAGQLERITMPIMGKYDAKPSPSDARYRAKLAVDEISEFVPGSDQWLVNAMRLSDSELDDLISIYSKNASREGLQTPVQDYIDFVRNIQHRRGNSKVITAVIMDANAIVHLIRKAREIPGAILQYTEDLLDKRDAIIHEMKKLEAERDVVISETKRLTTERDAAISDTPTLTKKRQEAKLALRDAKIDLRKLIELEQEAIANTEIAKKQAAAARENLDKTMELQRIDKLRGEEELKERKAEAERVKRILEERRDELIRLGGEGKFGERGLTLVRALIEAKGRVENNSAATVSDLVAEDYAEAVKELARIKALIESYKPELAKLKKKFKKSGREADDATKLRDTIATLEDKLARRQDILIALAGVSVGKKLNKDEISKVVNYVEATASMEGESPLENMFKRVEARRAEEEKEQAERAEAKRVADEKDQKERVEARRIADEKDQKARVEAKRVADEKEQKERAEARRVTDEKEQKERVEARRIAKEKEKKERAEATRIADEKEQMQREEDRKLMADVPDNLKPTFAHSRRKSTRHAVPDRY
jgi:hypothetical protein